MMKAAAHVQADVHNWWRWLFSLQMETCCNARERAAGLRRPRKGHTAQVIQSSATAAAMEETPSTQVPTATLGTFPPWAAAASRWATLTGPSRQVSPANRALSVQSSIVYGPAI